MKITAETYQAVLTIVAFAAYSFGFSNRGLLLLAGVIIARYFIEKLTSRSSQ